MQSPTDKYIGKMTQDGKTEEKVEKISLGFFVCLFYLACWKTQLTVKQPQKQKIKHSDKLLPPAFSV